MKKTIVVGLCLMTFMMAGVVMAVADTQPGSESDPVVTKSYVDARTAFTPISLKAGQKLIGQEGCEIILRSGEATAIDNGANGISDLTAGVDLTMGMAAGLNHQLLVPRTDGRGIAAKTDIWVMVKGMYQIQ